MPYIDHEEGPDFDPFGDENEDGVTCLHCGEEGLYWQETFGPDGQVKPRLYEDGKPHVCKPSADDFEVVK